VSSDPNRITVFDKLVSLAVWARDRRYFKASDAARHIGCSQRTIYRYLDTLMAIDERLSGEAGVGYYYRIRRPADADSIRSVHHPKQENEDGRLQPQSAA
jgi:hypothetical protein